MSSPTSPVKPGVRTAVTPAAAPGGAADPSRPGVPRIMAHRGAMAHAPENTLAAFVRAIDDGADIIETDLWLTADGHAVCHHDATLQRLCGDRRAVANVSADALAALRVTDARFPALAPQSVPTLLDLLALVPPSVTLALELKDPRFADPAHGRALAAAVADRIAQRRVFALSFELPRLLALRRVAPELPIGHISRRGVWPGRWTDLIGAYHWIFYANPFFVQLAHRRGQWVAPLDPRLHRRLRRYVALGVDAVLTDDPASTRRAVEGLIAGGHGGGWR